MSLLIALSRKQKAEIHIYRMVHCVYTQQCSNDTFFLISTFVEKTLKKNDYIYAFISGKLKSTTQTHFVLSVV